MTDSQQQAREILDRLVFTDFDLCLEISRTLSHLPRAPGIYAIRHRTEGLLYLGKTNDLSTRFNGGHKAFTWAWLDLYQPSDVRIAIELTVRSFFLVLRKLVKRYMWSFEPALLDDLLEF
jgi:predicted GIY-YIG superfamily endonuclease